MKLSALSAATELTAAQIETRMRRARLGDALVLELVCPGSWRVCDGRIAAHEPHRILAFVEERDGLFEVMQVADDFVWSTFTTMRSALSHVVETHSAVFAARTTGELAWLR